MQCLHLRGSCVPPLYRRTLRPIFDHGSASMPQAASFLCRRWRTTHRLPRFRESRWISIAAASGAYPSIVFWWRRWEEVGWGTPSPHGLGPVSPSALSTCCAVRQFVDEFHSFLIVEIVASAVSTAATIVRTSRNKLLLSSLCVYALGSLRCCSQAAAPTQLFAAGAFLVKPFSARPAAATAAAAPSPSSSYDQYCRAAASTQMTPNACLDACCCISASIRSTSLSSCIISSFFAPIGPTGIPG